MIKMKTTFTNISIHIKEVKLNGVVIDYPGDDVYSGWLSNDPAFDMYEFEPVRYGQPGDP
jgi:hypothetical protein